MMTVFQVICLVSVAIVMWRLFHVIATLDIRHFTQDRMRYFGIAGYWALIASGGVAALLGVQVAGHIILAGVALLLVSDRRQPL